MSTFTPLLNPFKSTEPGRVHVDEPASAENFCRQFIRCYQKLPAPQGPKILLCIGTDRSTGDCLGPLTGSKMQESAQNSFHVYGTLDQPVHAGNLEEHLALIANTYQNPFIIAIDACLGRLETVGYVNVGLGPIKPGAGVNKKLPPVGDMFITGIVNIGGFMEYFVLQNTRLNMVMKMANLITAGLIQAGKLL